MKKVLIIDDDKQIRDLFEDLFRMQFQCEEIIQAEDGLAGKHLCLKKKFDIIILDNMMPNLNGVTFLDQIRNSENVNRETPIIMITAYMPNITSDDNILENTLYLKKPVNFDSITRFVNMMKKSA